MRHITRLKQAEAARAASEKSFRLAFDNLPIGFVVTDRQGICLDVNAAFCEMLGYERDTLIGLSLSELTPPDDPYHDVDAVAPLVDAGDGVATLTKRRLRRDGTEILTLNRIVRIGPDYSREGPASFVLVEDITEREKTKQSLAASERLFRASFEQSPIGAALVDEDGCYVEVNGTVCRMLGYQRDELVGRSVLDFADPSDPVADPAGIFVELERNNGHVSLTKRYVRRDGEIVHAQLDVAVVSTERAGSGRPIRSLSLVRDITALQRAENAQRQSEAKFRSMFENSRRLIGILAPDGRNIETNSIGYAFTGLTPEQTRALYFWEGHWWLNDDDRERIKDACRRAATGEYVHFEIGQRANTGEIVTSDFSISAIHDVDGNVVLLQAEANDITQLKQAEEALRQSEAKFRSMFESSTRRICLMTLAGTVIDINPASSAFTGQSRGDISETVVWEGSWWGEDDTRARVKHAVRRAAVGEHVQIELPVRSLSGEIRTSDITINPILDAEGKVIMVMSEANDITNLRRARAALAESEELFRTTFESAPIGLALVDPRNGNFLKLNEAFGRMLQYRPDELVGVTGADITAPDDPHRGAVSMRALVEAGGGDARVVKRYLRRDGAIVHVQVSLAVVGDEIDDPDSYCICQVEDITERIRQEQELREAKELAQVTIASLVEGLVRTDAEGRITLYNIAASELLGPEAGNPMGRLADEIIRFRSRETGEALRATVTSALSAGETVRSKGFVDLECGGGCRRVVTFSCTPVRSSDGSVCGAVLVLQNAEAISKLTEELTDLTKRDHLTRLLNRRALEEHIAKRLKLQRRGQDFLLFIDLDHFKVVNDICGYAAGDELIRDIAALLQGQTRREDLLARLGGDEFAVVLHEATRERAEAAAVKLIESIQGYRFTREGRNFQVGASVGVASIEPCDPDVQAVMTRADRSCHAAKLEGRGRYHIHLSDDEAVMDVQRSLGWADRIKTGLNNDRFRLFLQKIVSAGGETLGYEALLRYIDDDGIPVSPTRFIPAAKRFDLMTRIDQWMIGRLLTLLADGLVNGRWPQGQYVSVNLGAKSLADSMFRQWLTEQLDLEPQVCRVLWIELTESDELRGSPVELQFLEDLQTRGIRLYLDDFGTGYNSFDVLKRINVDGLKIDRSVVARIEMDPIDQALMSAALSIAKTRGLDLVAEGVEERSTLDFLMDVGVSKFQGFLFHRPEPAESAIELT
ncbi:PAS domain S-box protein [Agrobacterium rhizogenes]|uniref:bifunctional diguanylate cyclase/phosphodiesterase n=1 Tax=Rhizobium rhizogenes TaxID=359 RepID=UPI00157223F3|nr:PAS domain S-box protein [Rhizobium rhizogenes]NTH14230.1 PAS domain S-box protein [Rhizobium rhizogenes]